MTIGRRGLPYDVATSLGEANDAELSVTGMAGALAVYRDREELAAAPSPGHTGPATEIVNVSV
jgi:hypothetical protein